MHAKKKSTKRKNAPQASSVLTANVRALVSKGKASTKKKAKVAVASDSNTNSGETKKKPKKQHGRVGNIDRHASAASPIRVPDNPNQFRFNLQEAAGRAKFIAWTQATITLMVEQEVMRLPPPSEYCRPSTNLKVWCHINGDVNVTWQLIVFLLERVKSWEFSQKVKEQLQYQIASSRFLFPMKLRSVMKIEIKYPQTSYRDEETPMTVARHNDRQLMFLVQAVFKEWKSIHLPIGYERTNLVFEEEEYSTDRSPEADLYINHNDKPFDLLQPTLFVASGAQLPASVKLPIVAGDIEASFRSDTFQTMWSTIQALMPHPTHAFNLRWHVGPSPAQRYQHWKTNDDDRLRLARYLIQQPNILIDTANDPAVPWKGQLFFHGTNYSKLQSTRRLTAADNLHNLVGDGVNDSARGSCGDSTPAAAAAVAVAAAALPKPLELHSRCRLRPKNSFTTPYYTKAMEYGDLVYTYRLTVDGKTLRLLDLRGDKEREHKWSQERIDQKRQDTFVQKDDRYLNKLVYHPANMVHELSGIEHNDGQNRVAKAATLVRFFEGTEVDGVVLNSDVEWIWLRPAEMLEWVRPDPVDHWLSWCLLMHSKYDKTSILQQRIESDITSRRLLSFLSSTAVEQHVLPSLSQVTTKRWRFNRNSQYTSQFEHDSSHHIHTSATEQVSFEQQTQEQEHSRTSGYHWLLRSSDALKTTNTANTTQWVALRCNYDDFWAAVAPWFAGCFMGLSVMEGNQEVSGFLGGVVPQLKKVLRSMQKSDHQRLTLSVLLPSGSRQLVPPLPLNNSSNRMWN